MPAALQVLAAFFAGIGLGVVFLVPAKFLASSTDFLSIRDLLWLCLAGALPVAALPWIGRRQAQPLLSLTVADGTLRMSLADGGAQWAIDDIEQWILVTARKAMDIPESGKIQQYGDEGAWMGVLLFTLRTDPPDCARMISRHSFPLAVLRQAAGLAAEATKRPLKKIRV